MSAPYCLITSCGDAMLPSDFDIFSSPFSSRMKPWVSTTSKGARPRVPQLSKQRGLEPAAMLVGAFEIHDAVLAAGGALDAFEVGTASSSVKACVEPESNQTSRMSVDLLVVGGLEVGRRGSARRPCRRTRRRRLPSRRRRRCARSRARRFSTSLVSLWTNTVIGTPQARWREITQSGRLSIMPVMRFSPARGTHCTVLMPSSARLRSVSPALERCPCPSR